MSSARPKPPWFQRKSAAWALGLLSALFIGTWLAGGIWNWSWSDGADWQAIWMFFTFLVAAIAAWVALAQLSAHHEAQLEQSRPYVIVDYSFRSVLLMIEVTNIGQTPAQNVRLAWDIEPMALNAADTQALSRKLVQGSIPFLAPGRSVRHFVGRTPDYWAADSVPKRYEVEASYTDGQGRPFGAGERMVLDLAQWNDATADTDYDNKNWNQFKWQTEAQKEIAKDLSTVAQHLHDLRETLTVLGGQLVTSRKKFAGSSGAEWVVLPGGGDGRRITNVGASTAESVMVVDVTNEEGRSGFSLQDEDLPHDVAVNDSILAGMRKSLADPFSSEILITWSEEGKEFEATYSVS
jgi:hypothetical protein